MAFKSSRLTQFSQQPVRDINMIPLIDVMLVLLIVFMVTAPLLTHAVKIELPKASSLPNQAKAEHIRLAIRASGELLWEAEPVSLDGLEERLKAAVSREPQPELHIYADASTPYQVIAQVMALTSRMGLSKIGFVSDPETPARH